MAKNQVSPLEQMRQTVQEQELSARSWKAYYEKMYFSLEAEKLEPEYKAYQERVQERLKQLKAVEETLKEVSPDLTLQPTN